MSFTLRNQSDEEPNQKADSFCLIMTKNHFQDKKFDGSQASLNCRIIVEEKYKALEPLDLDSVSTLISSDVILNEDSPRSEIDLQLWSSVITFGK